MVSDLLTMVHCVFSFRASGRILRGEMENSFAVVVPFCLFFFNINCVVLWMTEPLTYRVVVVVLIVEKHPA